MRVLSVRASAVYSGRAAASTSLGDLLVVIRDHESGGDGSVLVMNPRKGLLPLHWMGPAPPRSLFEEPGHMIFTRGRERLELFIETIHWEQTTRAELIGSKVMLGKEQMVSDLLAADLSALGLGPLHLVAREAPTKAGPIDILATDSAGDPVVVEVKRGGIGVSETGQLLRYTRAIAETDEWRGRTPLGVLVGKSLARTARAMIEDDPTLVFVRMTYEQLRARQPEAALMLPEVDPSRLAAGHTERNPYPGDEPGEPNPKQRERKPRKENRSGRREA